ncbi:FAD-binding protein [Oribacterium sp. FC2011]|uniref:FAD-binding protein n=1 Tax=Oribacterium sp. FC2011 TaxID=1408311 RepID=UPI0004E11364|nr:FAD-binding protein [Oribacterium sp. FC2011]
MSEKLTRRDFIKGMGATAVIAGLGSLTACTSGAGTPEATTAAATTAAATEAATTAAAAPAGGALYTPGTYTAGADGISSKVTVTMTFDESSITEVKINADGETASIGGAAVPDLEKALMDAQSAEFDAVSGATITSDAVKKAAANCIAQAKGEAVAATGELIPTGSDEDWLGEEPVVDDADIKDTIDTDILIVGAGNAGMMAAAYAASKGLNFRVIEQNAVVQDTRHWYGAINSSAAIAAGSHVDKKKLLSEISRYASGKCDQRVVKLWLDESAAMHDFVAGILENEPYNWKCDFTSGEEARWPDSDENTTFVFPEQEHNYRASESEYGMQRNEVFLEVIQKAGYDVDFKTALVKLEKDDTGRVTGVIAQNVDSGDLIRYNAKDGVLLACGGYPGNPFMMEQLDPLGTSVTTACSFSPADKGYGIRAAVWAGAHLDAESAPMLFDRGLVAPEVNAGYVTSESSFGGKAFPGTVRQYNPGTQPFLKVNRHGQRFANESSPYNDIVYAAAHQPGHVYAQIMDANYMEDIKRFHTIGCSAQSRNIPGYVDKQLEQYGEEGEGLIFKADTIEELADKLGFKDEDKTNFLATVERYNELYDKQEDEDFGKMKVRLSELRTAPFYGCWLGASLLTTEQGISINDKTQALDAENKPIPGLYIGGDMSGSFFANNYPCLMAGIACGRTLTFAMKSIKEMAGIEE